MKDLSRDAFLFSTSTTSEKRGAFLISACLIVDVFLGNGLFTEEKWY